MPKAARRLLRTITADGEHLYPCGSSTAAQSSPGVAEILARFPEPAVDGWTVAGWLRTPDPDLGEVPLDALARGEIDRVRALARSAPARWLRELGEPGGLRGFPSASPPSELVRVFRATSGTWWFSSEGSGRFDLPAPEGTCNPATGTSEPGFVR